MRLVVVRVEVHSVPTRGEEELSPQPVGAVLLEEPSRRLLPCRISTVRVVVIQAHEGDGLLGEVGRVVDPSVRVPGEHSEPIGERVDLLVLASWALEVAEKGRVARSRSVST